MAPDDPALAGLAQGELAGVWPQVNHKGMTAIYPPASMLLCGVIAALSPTPLAFKAAFTLLDLGVIAVLAAVLRLRGLPPARLLFYAANPLVIVFVCGEGHIDVLQVFFLVCACWALLAGRCALAGLALGLGAMAKYLALAAVPFFWTGCRRLGFAAVLLPALLFVPYLGAGSGLFASLGRFASDMQYNAFLADWLGRAWPQGWAVAAAFALLLCWLWVWLTEDDPLHAVYLALGCLLLLLPTLHPWYLALIAPFLCLFPSRAWLWLQAAMLFTFPVLGPEFRTGVFQEIPGVVWPEYLPFFALAALGFFRPNRLARMRLVRPRSSLSVVIPTLNEAGPSADAWMRCGPPAGCRRSSFRTAGRRMGRSRSRGRPGRWSLRPGRGGGFNSGRARSGRPATSCSSCTRTRCSSRAPATGSSTAWSATRRPRAGVSGCGSKRGGG